MYKRQYPKGVKDAERAIEALQHFAGPTDKIESFWSDGSPELKKAARKLEWRAGTSAPHRPSSNGVIERYIRKVVEAARALLAQAGFHHALWPVALEYAAFALNIEIDWDDDGLSPYSRRHGIEFSGERLPFGCLIDYKPADPDTKELPKFGPRGVPGIFLGYYVAPGGVWREDYLVVPLDEVNLESYESFRASFRHPKRVKEVYHDHRGYEFPVKQAADQTLRRLKEACLLYTSDAADE